jgi:diguanylate cyclase (GGDEF)-like protein/PAS domain S-box-containing protein
MQPRDILPVLYDLSVTIGSEIRLQPLLVRTLQRLLYHTSYSAGFICLDVEDCNQSDGVVTLRIDAAVGDFDLVSMAGEMVALPSVLVCGASSGKAEEFAAGCAIPGVDAGYRYYLRLPLDNRSLLVLMGMERPASSLALPEILKPVLAQFSRAILLCRNNDAQIEASVQSQKQMQHSLQQLESEFHSLVDLSPIGVCFTSEGRILDVNPVWLEMFGHTDRGELQGQSLLEVIAPSAQEEVQSRMQRRAQGLPTDDIYETMGVRRDGSEFPLLVSAKRVETDRGARTVAFFIDLTKQKQNELMLQESNQMLHLVLETAPIRIFWKDRNLNYLGCNTAFARDAGKLAPGELLGLDDFAMGWRAQADMYREDDHKVMASGKSRLNFDEPMTNPDGRTVWLRTSKVPLRNDRDEVIGVLGMYEDITDRKEAESHIHQLTFFDTLTGLPNRRLMYDRLHHALTGSARTKRYGALCMLDLDDFKIVNDTKGHATGDELLREVARRLAVSVREGDTVARLGGDEFVVILESLSDKAEEAATQAESIAEKLRIALHEPFELSGMVSRISTSIGIVTFLDREAEIEDLLKYADTAMYQAKAAGRDAIRFYDPAMQVELEDRLHLGEELMRAVHHGELRLYLQRQVDNTGRTIGAEALVRWQHPVRGLIPPLKFIPLAEESGMIVAVGKWVLETACAYLKSWKRYPELAELVLSINVSARQFRQPDFVASVQQALLSNGIQPSRLKLELTESAVLSNVQETIAKMRELKQLGVCFSMDDFGTGYSSLQYLKQLPLDQIKIDQSFVRDIASDANDAAIVQTVIAMTEVLGLDVIAEGVETEAQRAFLDRRGCHHFQGYLFGRPQPLGEFETSLQG